MSLASPSKLLYALALGGVLVLGCKEDDTNKGPVKMPSRPDTAPTTMMDSGSGPSTRPSGMPATMPSVTITPPGGTAGREATGAIPASSGVPGATAGGSSGSSGSSGGSTGSTGGAGGEINK